MYCKRQRRPDSRLRQRAEKSADEASRGLTIAAGGSFQGDSGPYTAGPSCGRRTESTVPRAQFFACGACGRTPGGGFGGTTCPGAPVRAAFPTMVEGAERDRLMERLNEFRRCSPRIFDGEKVDHWIVEKWLMHMEKLFRDTFVEERDRVWLATHHLDGEAYRWWLDLQENPSTDLAAISWKKFKELLLAHYFPTSVKRKME
uniref:Retrotransposon gag domain-containing protein n=1 Tax=Ananas comosus var. bracteatus TaxID=296719 RepID=A0A6V7NTM9_ANACO|nr:unnamed protein product [Ananas comosus var. bracteatus]